MKVDENESYYTTNDNLRPQLIMWFIGQRVCIKLFSLISGCDNFIILMHVLHSDWWFRLLSQ